MTVSKRLTVQALRNAIGPRLDGVPCVILLDVDGTLAPIAARPEHAEVPEETKAALRRLIASPGVTVALVSGRSAADAARLGGVEGVWVIGNHGIECRDPDGRVDASALARPFENNVAAAARALAPLETSLSGVIIENKRWTLSIHYRQLESPGLHTLAREVAAVAEQNGLVVRDGKKVIELRPPAAVDKGTAAVSFAERVGALRESGAVFYAGDDRTDEDAFRALRARSRSAVTVRVLSSDEGAEQPATEAEFALASTEELRELLIAIGERRG